MVNFRIISKIIGSLLFLESFFMAICLAMAFSFHEDDVMAFMTSTLMTFGSGCIFMFFGHEAENSLSRRDAYVVVTLTWVVFSFFGMFPFLIHGSVPSVTDAYFETMSGFTTTGATVIDDVESLPHGLLFWRSLMQWIGGLGIVFFTIAILPSLVGGSVRVFAAEATGPMREKMHPRLSTTAKWIWSVYGALTIACMLSYYVAGMGWFDSINYSMSITATGGFCTHNDTAAYYDSAMIDYVSIAFQFLAGINFTLLYFVLFKGRVQLLLKSSEFKTFIGLVIGATLWIGYLLMTRNGYGLEHAFRSALFHVVSFITTTGVFNDDASRWPHITWVILGGLMFIGACSGSTTGGFKCVRGVMVFKVLRNEFRKILHPNAVLPVKIDGQTVPQQKMNSLLAFFAFYVMIVFLSTTIMLLADIDITNSIVIALSLISNVGLSLSTEIGEVMSWADLPIYLKWTCSFLMLVGRLEIMSVLVLFTRAFWKDS